MCRARGNASIPPAGRPFVKVLYRAGRFLSATAHSQTRLKIDLQAQGKGPAARQFVVEIQRVEVVVLVSDIQQAERHFGFSLQKPVTDKRIQLPEIITGFSGCFVNVVLNVPMASDWA